MRFRYFSLLRSSDICRICTFHIFGRNQSGGFRFENIRNVFHNYDAEYGVFRSYLVSTTTRLIPSSFSSTKISLLPYIRSSRHNIPDDEVNLYTLHKMSDGLLNPNEQLISYYVNFNSLFEKGWKKINDVLEDMEKDPSVLPLNLSRHDQRLCSALINLEEFLRNIEYHEKCLFYKPEGGKYLETKLKALLVNHLLGPLVTPGKEHKIPCLVSDDTKWQNSVAMCPCAEKCDKTLTYDDTSFGSEFLWHGNLDVLLLPCGEYGPPVSIGNMNEVLDRTEYFEMTSEDLRSEYVEAQVASQAITFSLYKTHFLRKFKNSTTSLIPTICMTDREIDIYFYDSVNDILLRNFDYYNLFEGEFRSSPLPIFNTGEGKSFGFNLNTILLLWMTIHYSILEPKFPLPGLDILRGSGGISKLLEKENIQMEQIQEDIKFHSKAKLKNLMTEQGSLEDRYRFKSESVFIDKMEAF